MTSFKFYNPEYKKVALQLKLFRALKNYFSSILEEEEAQKREGGSMRKQKKMRKNAVCPPRVDKDPYRALLLLGLPIYAETILFQWDEYGDTLPQDNESSEFNLKFVNIKFKDNKIVANLRHGFPLDLCGGEDSYTFQKTDYDDDEYEVISYDQNSVIY